MPGLPQERFIDKITAYDYQVVIERGAATMRWIPYIMTVNASGPYKLLAKVAESSAADFEYKVLNNRKIEHPRFLSVAFTQALAAKPGYSQYNYNSPWIFPIRFINRRKQAERDAAFAAAATAHPGVMALQDHMRRQREIDATYGYRVETDGKVPDFAWYQETFSNDYSNGQDLSASADKSTDKLAKPGAK